MRTILVTVVATFTVGHVVRAQNVGGMSSMTTPPQPHIRV
jgi:hypothetical protein